MLEFKNVSVALDDGSVTSPFSLVLNQGEIACFSSSRNADLNGLLFSILGLAPTHSGYITIDGELVGVGAAAYFRQFISYIPSSMPDAHLKVSEFIQNIFNLQVNKDVPFHMESLMAVWTELGIAEDYYHQYINDIGTRESRLILLSTLSLIKRPIILINNISNDNKIFDFLRRLASDGAEIIYTSAYQTLPCDKLINL